MCYHHFPCYSHSNHISQHSSPSVAPEVAKPGFHLGGKGALLGAEVLGTAGKGCFGGPERTTAAQWRA